MGRLLLWCGRLFFVEPLLALLRGYRSHLGRWVAQLWGWPVSFLCLPSRNTIPQKDIKQPLAEIPTPSSRFGSRAIDGRLRREKRGSPWLPSFPESSLLWLYKPKRISSQHSFEKVKYFSHLPHLYQTAQPSLSVLQLMGIDHDTLARAQVKKTVGPSIWVVVCFSISCLQESHCAFSTRVLILFT